MLIIARILESLGIEMSDAPTLLLTFNDVSDISEYALEAITKLVNIGIIDGNNGNINPKDPITRAEVATIVFRVYNLISVEQSKL